MRTSHRTPGKNISTITHKTRFTAVPAPRDSDWTPPPPKPAVVRKGEKEREPLAIKWLGGLLVMAGQPGTTPAGLTRSQRRRMALFPA